MNIIKFTTLVLMLILSGCVGGNRTVMQKANVFSSEQINGNYQKNYQCLVNSDLEGNISDKQIYSEFNVAEIYIGAIQFSAWRHFYKIELTKTGPATTATLYSYKTMGSISEREIWEKIQACAK